MSIEPELRRVKAALSRHGVLLLQDRSLPSVATLVAREPIAGSWWGHPEGETIFHVLEALEGTLFTKLVGGKITLVHERLVPAIVTVGESRGRWQIEGLSTAARTLLAAVRRDGSTRLDAVSGLSKKRSAAANELEKRLLVHSAQAHTESGRHVRTLSTWGRFRAGAGLPNEGGPAIAEAKLALELAVTSLGARDAHGRLPWSA